MKEPALLSYSRSLHPTDAIFMALRDDGTRQPVPVSVKATLGTQSQYDKTGASKPGGNPQRVEFAALPHNVSKLVISFHLTVTGSALAPHSCDAPAWRDMLEKLAKAYGETDRFLTIGALYASNLANGRWAWKNRLFASSFEVAVTCGDESFAYQALDHRLDDLPASARTPEVQRLGALIAEGLRGERLVKMAVTGMLDLVPGATVYPSQEFEDKDDRDEKAIGKVLFGLAVAECDCCAAFHEQKIGNAIRTIDIWHKGMRQDGTEAVAQGTPLAVNPYGQSREAYVVARSRQSGNPDLYTLLKKAPALLEQIGKDPIGNDLHFVMANLVRGGVFGMKETKE